MSIDRSGWVNLKGANYFLDEYAHASGKAFMSLPGESCFVSLNNERDFRDAFNLCPPLKAIVAKRAKAFNTGKLYLKKVDSDEPARGYNEVKKLLRRPNALQNEKQFHSQQNHYVDIYGYCPVLRIAPSGFEGTGIFSSLWNIPPWLFDLTYTNKWLNQSRVSGIYSEYFMLWNGEKIKLNFDDLRFIFDDGIGTEDDTNLTIPDSRLVGMEYVISNLIATYKSRNTLATKRGAIGILSNESKDDSGTMPMLPGTKEDLQRDFSRYGLTGQPFQVIITDAALKWQQMGYATKDLMLFEEEIASIERLCDAYGWPVELISRGKDVTFDNKNQARKELFQSTIIPESESRMEQFSRIIFPDDENRNVEIARDFSEVPVLQEDRKTKAETRKAINDYCEQEWNNSLMTKNQWREELGLEPIPRPEFDKYKDELQPNETATGQEEDPEKVSQNGQRNGVPKKLPGQVEQ